MKENLCLHFGGLCRALFLGLLFAPSGFGRFFTVFFRLRVQRGLAFVLRLEQRCPFQREIAHGRASADRKAAVCQRVDPRAEAKGQQIAAEDFRLRRDVPQP